jgi:N-acetylneuraminic acid mutarotase
VSGTGGAAAGEGGSGGASGSSGAAGTGGAGGASGGGTGGTGSVISGEATEEETASLPANWQEHAVAAANGEVFVFGGYAPNATDRVIAYDPETDMWRDAADFIGPFNHANVGTVGDKIYLAGFYEAGGMSQASAQTFVYDPVMNDWNELTPMPSGTERAASCVAVFGTELYLFGGARNNQVVDDVSVYDTATDGWTELPPLPEPREHCAAGEIGGKLYIGGGRAHGIPDFEPNTWEFDPVAKTYQPKEPIPTPRGGVAGAVLGGRLFVFGGEGNSAVQSGVFGEIEAYDPATDSWEAFPPLAVPRHGFGAAVLADRIYLPGGANRQGGAAFDAASVFFFE